MNDRRRPFTFLGLLALVVSAMSFTANASAASGAAGSSHCPADIAPPGGDGVVDVTDLLSLLAAWGPNSGNPADLNGDGVVDVSDLLLLLAAWGPCPAEPTGGCCLPNGNCFDQVTASFCSEAGGSYTGDGNPCGDCSPPGSSCAGHCGWKAPAGCWCDEVCCYWGDCCLDKPAVCGACIFDCPPSADNLCNTAQFVYDNCVSDNALGLTSHGVIAWAQRFDAGPSGAFINNIATAYGRAGVLPGVIPCDQVGWAIMTDSGAGPGSIIAQGVGEVASNAVFTDRQQVFDTGSVAVSGTFYIVVWVYHSSGAPAPMDQSNPGPHPDDVWLLYTEGVFFGGFDPENPAVKTRMTDFGAPAVWMLRANQFPPPPGG